MLEMEILILIVNYIKAAGISYEKIIEPLKCIAAILRSCALLLDTAKRQPQDSSHAEPHD